VKVYGLLENISYPQKEDFISILNKNGYHIFSINSKIKEIAPYIFKQADVSKDILKELRKKGYLVNKLYWLNLLLSSTELTNDVLIEDIWEEDIYKNYIEPISLEKNEKNSIIYPKKTDVKSIETWLASLKAEKNENYQEKE
jgi:hypothetical protein